MERARPQENGRSIIDFWHAMQGSRGVTVPRRSSSVSLARGVSHALARGSVWGGAEGKNWNKEDVCQCRKEVEISFCIERILASKMRSSTSSTRETRFYLAADEHKTREIPTGRQYFTLIHVNLSQSPQA